MNIERILQEFSNRKILIVGDVMVDTYLYGDVNRISPEAPVPVVTIDHKEERPGGAANVAFNIKKLGAIPLLCSVIGRDEAGKSLTKLLKKQKISTSGLISSDERITTVKTRVISRNHQMIRYDSESAFDLNNESEQQLLKVVNATIIKEKPQALIFEDYNKGVLTSNLIFRIIDICRRKKIFTAADPKYINFFSYKNVTLFKPNLRELRKGLNIGIKGISETALNEMAVSLKKRLPHSQTLVTLSEEGIFYHGKKKSGIIPAHKHDVSDVSGAGDTVIAVATLCLLSGLSLEQSAVLSNLAGGLVCEYAGVVPVTKEMLSTEVINNKMTELFSD